MATAKSAKKSNTSKEELLEHYREMLLIRRFEEKAGQLYGLGLIGGFCHLSIGQKAVVVGLEAAAEEGDKRVTSYRDHGHMLACGMDPKGVMAELTGREGGYSKGKGGSMHMFSTEKHFYGGHGIVGAQVPIGAGLAFADKYKGTDNVTFTYFGDGAANQGQVAETYNMAELWDLPVIFVIENNQYAMGTSVSRSTKSPDFWERGAAYGIEGEAVDGMDVLAVRDAPARLPGLAGLCVAPFTRAQYRVESAEEWSAVLDDAGRVARMAPAGPVLIEVAPELALPPVVSVSALAVSAPAINAADIPAATTPAPIQTDNCAIALPISKLTTAS